MEIYRWVSHYGWMAGTLTIDREAGCAWLDTYLIDKVATWRLRSDAGKSHESISMEEANCMIAEYARCTLNGEDTYSVFEKIQ